MGKKFGGRDESQGLILEEPWGRIAPRDKAAFGVGGGRLRIPAKSTLDHSIALGSSNIPSPEWKRSFTCGDEFLCNNLESLPWSKVLSIYFLKISLKYNQIK